jgi:hypothetical protein
MDWSRSGHGSWRRRVRARPGGGGAALGRFPRDADILTAGEAANATTGQRI